MKKKTEIRTWRVRPVYHYFTKKGTRKLGKPFLIKAKSYWEAVQIAKQHPSNIGLSLKIKTAQTPSFRKNPLVDHLKRYAKRGASFGLNKLNTYAQSKLKNPQARATGTLFDTLRYDPYLYQKVYSPAAQALLREWGNGRFDRTKWMKKFRTVAEHTARTMVRTTGHIATRPEKMRFAFQLAKGFWDNVKKGMK